MIAALRFDRPLGADGERRIAGASFVPRSSLPVSAVCLVANAVRESLGRLLGGEIDVDVLEPGIPAPGARAALFGGALVYRVKGTLCDVFIVLRQSDARRLAATAYQEPARSDSAELSAIERSTLDRLMTSLAAQCAPICGIPGAVSREQESVVKNECASYFEVRVGGARRLAIGFALTRDPCEGRGEPLSIERLLDVEVEARVELGHGAVTLDRYGCIGPGETMLLASRIDEPGILLVGGIRWASVIVGECGAGAACSVLGAA